MHTLLQIPDLKFPAEKIEEFFEKFADMSYILIFIKIFIYFDISTIFDIIEYEKKEARFGPSMFLLVVLLSGFRVIQPNEAYVAT